MKYRAGSITRKLASLFLLLSALGLNNACATLPDVSEMIEETPVARNPQPVVSSRGEISPEKTKAIMDQLKHSVEPTEMLARHIAVVESITDSPLTKGNRVTLLADNQATYAAMFKAIDQAKNHINLESYIIEDDETGRKFADRLLLKQAAGVQVHLIYDSMGSINTPDAFFQRLRDGGIEVVGFNPVNPLKFRDKMNFTHRDHRKILIADGKIAIIGGVNISKVYSSRPGKRYKGGKTPIHWRDTDIRIEGPAVAELQKLFLDTWFKQKGSRLSGPKFFPQQKEKGNALVRVVGSTPGESNRIPFVVYVSAIALAENSVYLTNSYFIPDDQIVKALTGAARRGVDVKIILPGATDSKLAYYAQRYHYSHLLEAGVKVYEHKTSMLHAKTAVIDSVWSTVGSTNMDYLSLLNNDEVNAVILNKEFALEMEQMFASDLADSRAIELKEWQKRPAALKVREWVVNLFARWL